MWRRPILKLRVADFDLSQCGAFSSVYMKHSHCRNDPKRGCSESDPEPWRLEKFVGALSFQRSSLESRPVAPLPRSGLFLFCRLSWPNSSDALGPWRSTIFINQVAALRSEEHTSELQSLRHL